MSILDRFKSLFGRNKSQPVATRMYKAARHSRLTAGWQASTGTADAEINASLTSLRARSRALIRDSSYAKRARIVVVNNVIGAGIGVQGQVRSTRNKLMPRINSAIEESWKYWTRGEFCHVGGELHFADLERLVVGELFEAGECFVRMHQRSFGGSRIPFALEVIESERVPHDGLQTVTIANGAEVRMGVEVDSYYRPTAYYLRDRHPSDYQFPTAGGSEEVRRVPADEIIHLRIIDRWPQVRGVPWLHSVATKLNDMDGYSEAEITAARAASAYVGAYEGISDLFDGPGDRQDDGTYETEIEPGMILNPPPGRKFTLFTPNRPNSALDPFMRYMLREVAAGVGVSYESLSRDYSQSNYSSSRLSLLDDRDLWRVLQMWFIRAFRERVHRAWLQQAVFAKEIAGITAGDFMLNTEKYEAVRYKPRGWTWVDPTKEVAAYKEAIKAGFTTRTKVIAMTGGGDDVEDVDDERRQELDAAAEKGLTYDTDPGSKEAPPEDNPTSDDIEEEDETEEETKAMRIIR